MTDYDLGVFKEAAKLLSEDVPPILKRLGGWMDRSLMWQRNHMHTEYKPLTFHDMRNPEEAEESLRAVYQELLRELVQDVIWTSRLPSRPCPCISTMVPFSHNEWLLNRALNDIDGSPLVIIIPEPILQMFVDNNRCEYPYKREHHAGLIFEYRYQDIPVIVNTYHDSNVTVLADRAFRYAYKDMLEHVRATDPMSLAPRIKFIKDLSVSFDKARVRSIPVE